MATTTNYGWTTPDDTDLVKDGASAIRSLGTAIDSTVFTNAGNAVQKSTIDAKGDLLVGTADNTITRLAVGTNNYVLTADSAEASGVKWAAASSTPTFVGCSAISTSGTSTSNNTFTIVALQSEYFDTDSFHDNSTNNSRITIPSGKGGYYLILARSGFEGGNSTVDLRLYKNGAVLDDGYTNSVTQKSASPYIPGDLRTQAIVNLSAGDYIEMGVRQATGGSQDTWGENRLSVQFLGA